MRSQGDQLSSLQRVSVRRPTDGEMKVLTGMCPAPGPRQTCLERGLHSTSLPLLGSTPLMLFICFVAWAFLSEGQPPPPSQRSLTCQEGSNQKERRATRAGHGQRHKAVPELSCCVCCALGAYGARMGRPLDHNRTCKSAG